jgi:hypothetical protein
VNSNGEAVIAKVIKRVQDNEGNPIGKWNANLRMDTHEYECILDDGIVY